MKTFEQNPDTPKREPNPLFDAPVKGLGVNVPGGSAPEPRVPTKTGTVPLTEAQVAQLVRINAGTRK